MKRAVTAAAAAAAAVFAASTAPAVEIDAIAAQVDSYSILKSDVAAEIQYSGGDAGDYERARNALIERRLVIKAAAEAKLTMQEWVVENRIREIIKNAFEGDRNRLLQALSARRTTYAEWTQRIKDDMVVSAMRWQVVDKAAFASPEEMRAEFEAYPDKYAEAMKTTVSVILLKPEDSALRAAVEEDLKTQSFADVARLRSADSHAAEGGVWKDIDVSEVFRPEVEAAIRALKPGETSSWVELDGWSFLVRKDAEKAARRRTFAEAYEDVEANVKAARAERLYREWIERLKASSYIKIY